MATQFVTYTLAIIDDAKLHKFVGSTVQVSAPGATLPTITIQYDDAEKAGILETLDEVMRQIGYNRTAGP